MDEADEATRKGNLDELLAALREERTGDRRSEGDRLEDERLDIELLGLLAQALEERPAAAGSRERLLQAARAESRSEASAERSLGTAVASLGNLRAASPGAGTGSTGASAAGRTTPAPAFADRPPAWLGALAAALLLAVVGLGVFSGWLFTRLDDQEATIARLSDRLEAASVEVETLAAARLDLERGHRHLASRLALVASPGVEVCPLRPLGDEPRFPRARGLLFLSGPRDEWYVRVANVEPSPEGGVYHLWFVLGDEMIDAGALRPGGDGSVELAGSRLPPEDRMTAALVTLEPAVEGEGGRTASRPVGATILFGDEKMDMI